MKDQPLVGRFVFDYSAARSRKNRLYVKVAKELRMMLFALSILVVVCGVGVWIFGPQVVGALITAVGLLPVAPLMWFHYDIDRLKPHLEHSAEGVVELQEALHPRVAGRISLAHLQSPHALWHALSSTWYYSVFAVRFQIHDDVFDELSKEANPQLMQAIFADAQRISITQGLHEMSPSALLVALFNTHAIAEKILAVLKLEQSDIEGGVRWVHNHRSALDEDDRKNRSGGVARDWTAGFTPTLNRMSFKLSDFIESGGLAHQHVGSHRQSINEIVLNMLKPRANTILIGEVGSGKTMTVNGFAKRILQDKSLPPSLRYHRVYQVSASAIISSSPDQATVETTLYSIVVEAAKSRNAILYFDNTINFFTAGNGATDLSRALLEIVKNSSVPVILEMTPTEWQQVSAQHSELAAVLNQLHIPEADERNTLDILEDHCLQYEARSGVMYTFKALKECIILSDRYVQGLVFPGKGISLLESAVSHAEGAVVTAKSMQETVEATYGIKVQTASAAESKDLLKLEDQIHERMVNQVRAVRVVSDALRRARSGVSSPDKPIGTFLFLGPTGVGKTELAKALSEKYFGDDDDIVRVDMNEYTQSADLTRLLDVQSPTSLLSAVGRTRFTVVLFDEIEKAHPDVVNALLQLLDEGQMRDSANRVVSFRDTIVIATSNAGADKIRRYIDQGKEVGSFEKEFINELIDSGLFKPEFLNRFDESVVFRPLNTKELLQVADLLLAGVNKTLARQKISVSLSLEAKQWLVERGNDPRLGARPLKRMVQRTVENIVAKRVLQGTVQPGAELALDVADLEAETAQD